MHYTRRILRSAVCLLICAPLTWAQFTTGSTGSDGAFAPTISGDFDPVALGLDPSGDNVFNFTTINIPAGVTIKLRASKLGNAAVTWLATGNVTIAGTLDLSGAGGGVVYTSPPAQLASSRVLPEPGPGGYTGGLGSSAGVGPQSGAGPGGGPAGLLPAGLQAANTCYGGAASFISSGATPFVGAGLTYGSYLLVPLYGGSGGGGGWDSASGTNVGGIGGAGGGAIRIASNTQINITGIIDANGGDYGSASGSTAGCSGGAGSGGAIHLIAPTILGAGSLTAVSGNDGNTGYQTGICSSYYSPNLCSPVNNGIIRLSANTNKFSGTATGAAILGPLYLPPANSTLGTPSLRITQVNGVSVPSTASGQFLNPDVVISATGAVTVNLAAANIPLGTIASLRITQETGADTTISCAALAGTLAASTATCSATFPFSISITGVRASW